MTDHTLHVFGFCDADFIVAYNLDDARQVLKEECGFSDSDFNYYEPNDFVQLDDELCFSICCDADGILCEIGEGEPVSHTASEWAQPTGRGYLCTTEG